MSKCKATIGFPFVTFFIFTINAIWLIVYYDLMLWRSNVNLINLCALVPTLFCQGEYWRLITASFAHANLLHFIGNMTIILPLSLFLEAKMGHLKFFLVYFTILIISGFLWVYAYYGSPMGCIGASDIAFGLIPFTVLYFRNSIVKHFSKYLFYGLIFYLTMYMCLLYYYLFRNFNGTNIAHFWGWGVGLILGVFIMAFKKPTQTPSICQCKPTKTK